MTPRLGISVEQIAQVWGISRHEAFARLAGDEHPVDAAPCIGQPRHVRPNVRSRASE
jgi:hypothetical protein